MQKTYQFINVVNGVSHSHKTANLFFSFDSVAKPVNWNVYIGLRDAITSFFEFIFNNTENALQGMSWRCYHDHVICIRQQIHHDASIIATNIHTSYAIDKITNIKTKQKRLQHVALPYTISNSEETRRTILPANKYLLITVPICKQPGSKAGIHFNWFQLI